MKTLFKTISFLIFLFITLFVLLNLSNTIAIETSFLSLRVNVGFLILLSTVLSSIGTLLFLISMNLPSKSANNFKKQFENAKLGHEIESSKVNQLEEKIKTLEEAIKKAVSDK